MMKKFRKLPVILALMMVISIIPGKVSAVEAPTLSTPVKNAQSMLVLEQGDSYSYASLLNTLMGQNMALETDNISLTFGVPFAAFYLQFDNINKILTVNNGECFTMPLPLTVTNSTIGMLSTSFNVVIKYQSSDFSVTNPYASTSLKVGDSDQKITYQLAKTLTGPNQVIFASSNPSVLTVGNLTGLLHVVSAGTATITSTLQYGVNMSIPKTITYTVSASTPSQPSTQPVVQPSTQPVVQPSTQPVTQTATGDVTLDANTMELKTGETDNLSAVCDSAVTWNSSDTSIATVDSQGNVTAVAPGSATITCSSASDSASCTVTVSSWTVSWNVSSSTLQVGKKTTVIKPVLEDGDSVQSYSSSNPKVADISSTGRISALKAGSTVLTVKTANGATASMNLTCKKGKVLIKTITVPTTTLSLKVKDTYTINPVVAPISSSEKLSYESTNKKIAKVSSTGKITAKKAGKCTILVKSQNKVKKIKVTVTK